MPSSSSVRRGTCNCSPQRAGNPDQPELRDHAASCPYLKFTVILNMDDAPQISDAELARQYADDGVVWGDRSLNDLHYSDQEPS